MTRTARLLALVALLAVAGTSAAIGFWGATGTGTATATVGTLAAPTGVTGAPSGGNVNVSWTGVTAPGGGAIDGYRVTRTTSGSTTNACGGALVTTTSCVDTAVPSGQHTYAVTSVFRTWSAVSQPSATVTVADTTAPAVSSINLNAASPTNATTVTWTVKFTESVTGVTTSNFSLSPTLSGASVSGLTGSGDTYTVTASTGTGSGPLQLNLSSTTGIKDAANNALTATFSGQHYTIDKTAPTVASMTRTAATPSKESSAGWTVVFTEAVTGVDTNDFTLVATGLTGTSITTVTGSGATYTVTASTGAGDGTLRLDVPSGATLSDAAGNGIGGGFTGTAAAYTIDRTAPTIDFTLEVKTTGPNSKLEMNGGTSSEANTSVTVLVCRTSFPCTEGSATYVAPVNAQSSNKGQWSGATGNLSAGTYYARAQQTDAAGNIGYSAIKTQTIQ